MFPLYVKDELVVASQNSVFGRILRLHPSLIRKSARISKAAFHRNEMFHKARAPLVTAGLSCVFSMDRLYLELLTGPHHLINQRFLFHFFSTLPPHEGINPGHSLQPQPTCNLAESLCLRFQANFLSNFVGEEA